MRAGVEGTDSVVRQERPEKLKRVVCCDLSQFIDLSPTSETLLSQPLPANFRKLQPDARRSAFKKVGQVCTNCGVRTAQHPTTTSLVYKFEQPPCACVDSATVQNYRGLCMVNQNALLLVCSWREEAAEY